LKRVEVPLLEERLRQCWQACQGADTIVVSLLPFLFAYYVAEQLGVPLVRAYYFPVSPTRTYAAEYIPGGLRLPGRVNLATHLLSRHVLWQVARPGMTRACRTVLGIRRLPLREPFSRLDRERQLLLYGYSPAVIPRPPDWGNWIDVTGYWFPERSSEWQPSSDLVTFLGAGPPPVYIGGFGRMTARDRGQLTSLVLEAAARAGQRAVLLTGKDDLTGESLPRTVFPIDWVPFDWLFPRVSAVVHHGGAGTTGIGLRAGVPSVIVPFFLDNFFWGRQIHALGLGPRPIPRKHLSVTALADAIGIATSDVGMRQRAAALAQRIQTEDGIGQAVLAFERHFA
jgi:sterol 3beta-glucosyltransferase